MTLDEVCLYIKHKIKAAGGAESIIGEDALSALSGYCKGNPRIIGNVMTTPCCYQRCIRVVQLEPCRFLSKCMDYNLTFDER